MPKPFIFAVDTEQQIAGALERDLPKRYGADYEVVIERSPLAALERLRALRQTDAEVALLVVGIWMAEMPGLQMLDHAHALFPDAKRLLLIAYVDPTVDGVAATATALDQFDAYVSKPWVSPEEWLYPAIGELLSEWAKDHLPCFEAVRVVGSQWSPDTHLMRDLLERNPVPYGFYPDDSAEGRLLLTEYHLDAGQLPAAILYDGQVLARPKPVELAAALGASLRPRRRLYDVAVIGAGPAGLAAAVYGASEGLHTVVVEAEAVGGQAGTSSLIRNYLGFERGVTGRDLATRAYQQATVFGADIVFMRQAMGLHADGETRVVTFDDDSLAVSRTVVIATGVSYRRLGIPRVEALLGRGVYYGAAVTEAPGMRGLRVFVAGAGNSAGQAALYLAKFARQVTILARGDGLAASMADYLVKQIAATPNIEVRVNTQVVDAHGTQRLERLDLRSTRAGPEGKRRGTPPIQTEAADALFVLIGADPYIDWLARTLARDAQGFICTGHDLLGPDGKPPSGWPLARPPYYLETSLPGVFAVGDVRSGSTKRVASAVGEGATAIALVHQYLST